MRRGKRRREEKRGEGKERGEKKRKEESREGEGEQDEAFSLKFEMQSYKKCITEWNSVKKIWIFERF